MPLGAPSERWGLSCRAPLSRPTPGPSGIGPGGYSSGGTSDSGASVTPAGYDQAGRGDVSLQPRPASLPQEATA